MYIHTHINLLVLASYHFEQMQKPFLLFVPLPSPIQDIIVLNTSVYMQNHISVVIVASTVKHNLEISRREEKCDSSLFSLFFPFLMFQDSFFYHLLYVQRTSYSDSFMTHLVITDPFGFPLLENVLVSSFFPEAHFHWTYNSVLTVLFFMHLKYMCHFFWPLQILMRNQLSLKQIFLYN